MGELARRLRKQDPKGFSDWSDDEVEVSFLKEHGNEDPAYKQLADTRNRIYAQNLAVEKADQGVRAAAALPPSIEKNFVENAADAAAPYLEPMQAPATGLGMLADMVQTGGKNITLPPAGQEQGGITGFLTGGARLEKSLPEQAVDTLRRRVALSANPFEPTQGASALENFKGAIAHGVGAATGIGLGGLGLGTGEIPGQEQHIRDSFEQQHKPLAIAEAVAEPVAEMGAAMVLDPAMAGLHAAGALSARGLEAQGILRSSAPLTSEAAESLTRLANAGTVARGASGALGAAFIPGMAGGAGQGLGTGLASLDQGKDVEAAKALSQGSMDLGFAGMAGSHLFQSLAGRSLKDAFGKQEAPAPVLREEGEPLDADLDPNSMLAKMRAAAGRFPQSDPEAETNKPQGTQGRNPRVYKDEKGRVHVGNVRLPDSGTIARGAAIPLVAGAASMLGTPMLSAGLMGWMARRQAGTMLRGPVDALSKRATRRLPLVESKPKGSVGTPDPAIEQTGPAPGSTDSLRSYDPTLAAPTPPTEPVAPVSGAPSSSLRGVPMAVPAPVEAPGATRTPMRPVEPQLPTAPPPQAEPGRVSSSLGNMTFSVPAPVEAVSPAGTIDPTVVALLKTQYPRGRGTTVADWEASINTMAQRIRDNATTPVASAPVEPRQNVVSPEERAARAAETARMVEEAKARMAPPVQPAPLAEPAPPVESAPPVQPAPIVPVPSAPPTVEAKPATPIKSKGSIESQFGKIREAEKNKPKGIEGQFAAIKEKPLSIEQLVAEAVMVEERAKGKAAPTHPKNAPGVTTKDLESHPDYTEVMRRYATGELADMHGNKILPMEENDRRARAIAFRVAGKAIEQAKNVQNAGGLEGDLKASVKPAKNPAKVAEPAKIRPEPAKAPRVNVKKALANPEQRREMMSNATQALQNREGINTTPEQARAAYDKVQAEKAAQKTSQKTQEATQKPVQAPQAVAEPPKAKEAPAKAPTATKAADHYDRMKEFLAKGEFKKAADLARSVADPEALKRTTADGKKIGYVNKDGVIITNIAEDGMVSRVKAPPKPASESQHRPGAEKQYGYGTLPSEVRKNRQEAAGRIRREMEAKGEIDVKGELTESGKAAASAHGRGEAPDFKIRTKKVGDGLAHQIVVDGEVAGRVAGFEEGDTFHVSNTVLSDESLRGTGLYRKAMQQVANQYKGGAYVYEWEASKALQSSLKKMPTFEMDGERIRVRPEEKQFSVETDFDKVKGENPPPPKTSEAEKPFRMDAATKILGKMMEDAREAETGKRFSAKESEAPKGKDMTVADIRAGLPEGLRDKLYKDGETGDYMIDTPRGTIRIRPEDHIAIDFGEMSKAYTPEEVAEAKASGLGASGEKSTIAGDALVRIVDQGELPHEVGGHVYFDHFSTGKERSVLIKKFSDRATGGKNVKEVIAEAYKAYHDRMAENPGWQPTSTVGKFIKNIYDFMHSAYRAWKPTAESIFEGVRTGKSFERAPEQFSDTGMTAPRSTWSTKKVGASDESRTTKYAGDGKGYAADKTMVDSREFRSNESEPVLVAGGSAGRNVPVAKFDKPSFTIKATPKEPIRILMPDGTVKRLTTRGVARLMGVPDEYPLSGNEALDRTVLGNGVPPPLMKAVVDPLMADIKNPRGVTLFSGGGIAETMLKDKIEFVGAVEYSKEIADQYRKAHGDHVINADVRDVDFSQWGEVDYLHASPVCKNFSSAKALAGEVELDLETAKATARAITETNPKVVTVENVPGYMKSEAMRIITDTLRDQGYKWDANVFDAADYGVPQHRDRMILRAVKDGELPPLPSTQPQRGWFDAVAGVEPRTDKGLAAWQKDRLNKQGQITIKGTTPEYSASEGPRGPGSALGRQLKEAQGLRQARSGVKGLLETQKPDMKPRLVTKAADEPALQAREPGVQRRDGLVVTKDSIAPAQYSIRTKAETVRAAMKVNEKSKTFTDEQIKKFASDIDTVTAKILEAPERLDFTEETYLSALKSNADPQYKKSEDYTTMCRRRYILSATVDAVQAKTGRVLEAEDIIKVRKMLEDKGHEVNCGACYVESRRIHMATVIKKAQDGYTVTSGERKGEAMPALKVPKELLLTQEGRNQIAREYPDEYKKFTKLFAGTQMKVPVGRAAYKGEYLSWSQKAIDAINRVSGARSQSWSDFEVPHLLDKMQATLDKAVMKIKGHSYTKEVDYVETMKDTNEMINMSLIPEGSGFDGDGNLAWRKSESFRDIARGKAVRKTHSNVGFEAIGISDAHIKAMLADPEIDYVIPYHASGLKAEFQRASKMDGWKDYTEEQHWRDAKTGKPIEDVERKVFINEWKGDLKKLDAIAKERGVIPPFERMRNWKGYEKLLTDRRIWDSKGKFIEQQPVRFKFDMDHVNRMLDEYKGGHDSVKGDQSVIDSFAGKGEQESPKTQRHVLPSEVREMRQKAGVRLAGVQKAVDGFQTDEVSKRGGRTAIERPVPSAPATAIMDHYGDELKAGSMLEWGGGKGADTKGYKAHGVKNVQIWDPVHAPGNPGPADVVTSTYVVNVLEPEVRHASMKAAYDLARKKLIVSARTDTIKSKHGLRQYKDGVMMGEGKSETFQKQYSQKELEDEMAKLFGAANVTAFPGKRPGGAAMVVVDKPQSGAILSHMVRRK